MAKTKEKPKPICLVEELAKELPVWELAALRQATGWVKGRQVTEAEFNAALQKLRTRPQGGGKI